MVDFVTAADDFLFRGFKVTLDSNMKCALLFEDFSPIRSENTFDPSDFFSAPEFYLTLEDCNPA